MSKTEAAAPSASSALSSYMHWAKTRPAARFDLAISNVVACSIDDLPGAADALALTGDNDNGYGPLVECIAQRYGVTADQVATAQGTSGANFLVCAALLSPRDDVLVERPGYEPLVAAARLLGANVARYERTFEDGYRLDPERVADAMTPRTKLVIVTSPHNPTGAIVDAVDLQEVGRIAARRGAQVLVDEVYLDSTGKATPPAARQGAPFISTSSLTKSYGLSGLRCGWTLSSPDLAERLRRARDVVDGTGSIVAERLSVLAFRHLDMLMARTRELLTTNGALMQAFLQSRQDLEYIPPRGGTVVFPRIRGVEDTAAFAQRLLADYETAVVPGRFFDAPGHIRVGFSGATDRLSEGLERLRAALDSRRKPEAGSRKPI
jgi:aspartate/methionine/tyrosine aminotransferase